MEVDAGVAYDDVYTQVGIESKLCATPMLVAIAVRRCMRWRPGLTDCCRLAGARRYYNPLATPDGDGDHECSKESFETNHGRYPRRGAIGGSGFRLDRRRRAGRPAVSPCGSLLGAS
jgi:hypothetical protein